MLKAIERGYVQQEIQNAAYEYQQQVDQQQAVVVGVNRFVVEEGKAYSAPAYRRSLRAQTGRTAASVTSPARRQAVERLIAENRRRRPLRNQPDAPYSGRGRSQRNRWRDFRHHATSIRGI